MFHILKRSYFVKMPMDLAPWMDLMRYFFCANFVCSHRQIVQLSLRTLINLMCLIGKPSLSKWSKSLRVLRKSKRMNGWQGCRSHFRNFFAFSCKLYLIRHSKYQTCSCPKNNRKIGQTCFFFTLRD